MNFDRWDEWLINNNVSALEACLNYPLEFEGISKVVLGVNDQKQLNEIIMAATKNIIHVPSIFSCQDVRLINPVNWSSL